MRFEKWQALGNDYIILERQGLPFELTPKRVRRLCAAHFGAHSDGILLLSPSEDPAHVATLQIFNPDGSEADLSGNGARQAALYLRSAGWTDDDEFSIVTAAGAVKPTITGPGTATMDLGQASTRSDDFPSGDEDGRGELSAGEREWAFQHVAVGNPQCAIEVESGLEELDLSAIGPEIENHTLFPNRTNVSFWHAKGSRVRARIFERGVGETLSSGTGAAGAAVSAYLRGSPGPHTVELDGGELEVTVSADLELRIAGAAEPVFSGEFSPEFVRSLE
jgi:diaminopimelate epimerase